MSYIERVRMGIKGHWKNGKSAGEMIIQKWGMGMKYKQAQMELSHILYTQKSVKITRLKPIIESYERMINISQDSRIRVVELSKLLEKEREKTKELQDRINGLNQELRKGKVEK